MDNQCIDDTIKTDDNFTSEEVIGNLLVEFKEQREALKKMIDDLDSLKENIDKLFPKQLDARFQRFFEDKIKSATGLLGLLLDIRKEITKTIKDEIEIRRRIKDPNSDESIENLVDIRGIVKRVEKLKKDTIDKKEKITVAK